MFDALAVEDGPIAGARARATGTINLPSPAVGALLKWAAATTKARHTVEIGAAGGVSALWMLQGMGAKPVLTSIEPDGTSHRFATTAYDDAGTGTSIRSMLADPRTVLPRLSDEGYDVVLVQSPPATDAEIVEHAVRLLRPGGILVIRSLEETAMGPGVVKALAEQERVSGTVLPVDGGLLLATKADQEPDGQS